MALHLFMKSDKLHLLSGYESGEVVLRRCTSGAGEKTIEGRGWECLWKTRQHTESGGFSGEPRSAYTEFLK